MALMPITSMILPIRIRLVASITARTPLLHINRAALPALTALIITVKQATVILLRPAVALIAAIAIVVLVLQRALDHAMAVRGFAAELGLDG